MIIFKSGMLYAETMCSKEEILVHSKWLIQRNWEYNENAHS